MPHIQEVFNEMEEQDRVAFAVFHRVAVQETEEADEDDDLVAALDTDAPR